MRVEATTPEFTAADAVAMATAEPEASETVTPAEETVEEPETVVSADEEPPETDPEAETDDEDASEEDDLDLPQLNAKAKEAIGDNPEALKAWEEAWKGVIKRETRFKEREQHYQGLTQFEAAFEDPSQAPLALEQVIQYVNKTHGLNLSINKAEATTPKQTEGEFEYESDKLVYEKAVADAEKRVLERLGVDPATLQTLAKRAKEADERQAFEAQVAKKAPLIIAKAEKTEAWKVTKDMVAQAMNDPTFDANPVAALKRAFPDKWAEHKVEQAGKKRNMPEMLSSQSAKGYVGPKEGEELSAEDAVKLAMMNL